MSSPSPVIIALDAMGGDHAPKATVNGAIMAVNKMPNLTVKLVGQPAILESLIAQAGVMGISRIQVVSAPDVIAPDAVVTPSIRYQTNTSLAKTAALVRDGQANAMVGLGNTALTAAVATLMLGRQKGIQRPAIAAQLPRSHGRRTILLDVGATIDCTPLQLYQFAQMGYAYASSMGIKNPKVGLLSIGEEETKGNAAVKETHKLLNGTFGFIGNVEGHDIMNGEADIIVCDGFVGNCLLKEAEGFLGLFKSLASESSLNKILAGLLFRRIGQELNYRNYGGCPLMGLNRLCMIGHGKSDEVAACNAILAGATATQNGLIQRTKDLLKI